MQPITRRFPATATPASWLQTLANHLEAVSLRVTYCHLELNWTKPTSAASRPTPASSAPHPVVQAGNPDVTPDSHLHRATRLPSMLTS